MYFGSYPKEILKDADTITIIDNRLKESGKNYGDVWANGYKHTKVKVGSEDKYYTWRRIGWNILDIDEEKNCMLLITYASVDAQKYGNSSNWSTSDLDRQRSLLRL